MSNKESSIHYKRIIRTISVSKNYELLVGCDIVDNGLFKLHTKNAIYTHFASTSTEEYKNKEKSIIKDSLSNIEKR